MNTDERATETHRTKLRRLRVLQTLSRYEPMPLGERALLNELLRDRELQPTLEKVRDALDYLAEQGLVHLVVVDHADWRAAWISDDGQYWLQSPDDHDLEIHNPGYRPPPSPAVAGGRGSRIDRLPAETRAWIDAQLIERNFTDYSQLTAMLREQGLEITRSSLGRYAKRLKEQVARYREKAEMVKSLAGVFEEDAPAIMQGAMGTAVTAVLDAIEEGRYNEGKESLSSLVKALPALGRGFRDAERHRIEQETRRKTIEEAARVGEEAVRAQGLDDEQARFWREKFLKGM